MEDPRRRAVDPQDEERELRFWDEHDPSDLDEGPADIIVRLRRRPKKVVTFRLDQELYDQLRGIADEHGVPYQRLMRELLRDSVARLSTDRRRRRPSVAAR